MRLRAAFLTIACAAAFTAAAHAQNGPPPPPPPPPIMGGGGGGTGGGGTGGGGGNPAPPTNPYGPIQYPTGPRFPGGSGGGGGSSQNFGPGQGGNQGGGGGSQGNGGGRGWGGTPNFPTQPGYNNYPPNQNNQYPQQPGQQSQNQNNQAANTAPPAPAPPPVHVVDWMPSDQTLYVVAGDVVRFKGHYTDNDHPLDHSFLELDRARVTADTDVQAEEKIDVEGGQVVVRPVEDATSDNYDYEWTAVPGDHYLRVGYVTSQRAKRYAQYAHVVVMDKSPFVFDPDKLSSVSDIPVTITLDHDTPFLAKSMDVYFDDKKLGDTVTGPPFKFTLTTASATPGKHALRIEAIDGSGGRFEMSDSTAVDIPKRVTLDVPREFTESKAGDVVAVTAKFGAGFKPTKVEYYVKPEGGDEKLITKSDAAPFDGKLDLTTYPSGHYTVHAVGYAGKTKYDSDEYPLAFNNPYGADLAAKAAQDAAVKQEQQRHAAEEQQAAADLRDHPKLTWEQVNDKVTDTIANFLAARPPGNDGKRWTIDAIKHIRQPDQSQNVYLVAAIVNSPDRSGAHVIYSVDLDKGTVTDTEKTW